MIPRVDRPWSTSPATRCCAGVSPCAASTSELFAREVLPEFVERDERRQREKAERLAPVIDAVMARKPATDHPPLDPDYEIPAYPRQDADRQEGGKFHRWLDDYTAKIAAGEDVSKRRS